MHDPINEAVQNMALRRQQAEAQSDADPINPAHYKSGDIECIDAIEAAVKNCTTPAEGYLTGNIIKYIWRWQKKGGEQDLRKALQYINRLINHTKGKKSWEL